MDIAGLQAFIAVAEEGSFSLAADHLFVTQPAISKRVQNLEQQLEAPLFDRIGRRVRLTEAGRVLLPRARRLLQDLEDSRRAIADLKDEVSGILSMGTSHHIGLHHLAPVLRTYSTLYPEVELDLHFMDSEAACHSVLRGELELAVVTLPPNPDEHLVTQPLWPDPLHIVAARDHSLAALTEVPIATLAEVPAILPAASTYTRQIAEQTLKPLGLTLNIRLSTNYLETIRMLVAVGLGWSILPATLLDERIQALPLAVPLQLQRTLGVVHHRDHSLSNAGRTFVSALQN